MLKDIKIIDFTNYIPSPFATLRLAEFGAVRKQGNKYS